MMFEWKKITLMSVLCVASLPLFAQTTVIDGQPEQVKQFVQTQQKRVITFEGYSGAGYEHIEQVQAKVKAILQQFDPHKVMINAGATAIGIGLVYPQAKALGFTTMGIVSSQVKRDPATTFPDVEHVFIIRDPTWGGLDQQTQQLSPTSQAMVDNSDIMIAFGGGAVTRDEMRAGLIQKKAVCYYPEDQNHQLAIAKAAKKQQPVPVSFRGDIDNTVFAKLNRYQGDACIRQYINEHVQNIAHAD